MVRIKYMYTYFCTRFNRSKPPKLLQQINNAINIFISVKKKNTKNIRVRKTLRIIWCYNCIFHDRLFRGVIKYE